MCVGVVIIPFGHEQETSEGVSVIIGILSFIVDVFQERHVVNFHKYAVTKM